MLCVTPFRGWFGGVCTRVGSTYMWEWAPRVGSYQFEHQSGSSEKFEPPLQLLILKSLVTLLHPICEPFPFTSGNSHPSLFIWIEHSRSWFCIFPHQHSAMFNCSMLLSIFTSGLMTIWNYNNFLTVQCEIEHLKIHDGKYVFHAMIDSIYSF